MALFIFFARPAWTWIITTYLFATAHERLVFGNLIIG
jgi:hypothetical protein